MPFLCKIKQIAITGKFENTLTDQFRISARFYQSSIVPFNVNYNIWNCFFLGNCINKYQLWHLPLNIQIECQSTRKKIERQSTRIYFYLFGICDILNSLGLQTKYLSTRCSLVGSVLIDSNGIQIRLLSSHPIQKLSEERCVQSDFKGIALNWSDL